MLSWKPFLSRAIVGALVVGAAVGAGVFVGVRLAAATPGGRTHNALTYSGVLHGAPEGMRRLTFTFQKPGAICGPIPVDAPVAAGGAFTVPVPIDRCPTFFDGDDVTYAVAEGSDMLVSGARITPVPHARFADQAGVTSDCPAGYGRDDAASSATVTVCTRTIAGGRDDVVKVGLGASAFWVDRYEARVFDAMGRPYGASDASYPNLAPNGQWTAGARGTLQALSRAGGAPSTRATWFQANALCAAAGKALMTREEWFLAADGLVAVDPAMPLNGDPAGVTGCNTDGTRARNTGLGTGCASSWGAQDMIGNVWEWTAEWYASVGQVTSPAQTTVGAAVTGIRVNDNREVWGADYGNDNTINITSVVYNTGEGQIGVPSAALRGGAWNVGRGAGVFALDLAHGPSYQNSSAGFRCVVRK